MQVYFERGAEPTRTEPEQFIPTVPPHNDSPFERINRYLRGEPVELYNNMFFADIKPYIMLNKNSSIEENSNGNFIAYKDNRSLYYLFPNSRYKKNFNALWNNIKPIFDMSMSNDSGVMQVKTPCVFKPGDNGEYIASDKGSIYFI
jgi:hypothetical protein